MLIKVGEDVYKGGSFYISHSVGHTGKLQHMVGCGHYGALRAHKSLIGIDRAVCGADYGLEMICKEVEIDYAVCFFNGCPVLFVKDGDRCAVSRREPSHQCADVLPQQPCCIILRQCGEFPGVFGDKLLRSCLVILQCRPCKSVYDLCSLQVYPLRFRVKLTIDRKSAGKQGTGQVCPVHVSAPITGIRTGSRTVIQYYLAHYTII